MRTILLSMLLAGLPAVAHATACSVTGSIQLECGDGVRVTTFTNGPSNLDLYQCGSRPVQDGVESVRVLECDRDEWVDLKQSNLSCDADFFVFADVCDSDEPCVAWNTDPGAAGDYTAGFWCEVGRSFYIVTEIWAFANSPSSCPRSGLQRSATYDLEAICDERCDGEDRDRDRAVDCDDVDCCFAPNLDCTASPPDQCCDVDGDGFTAALAWCGNGSDCNDNAADVSPLGTEIPGDGIDQDCDGVDDCWLDLDGDGFGDPTRPAGPGTTLDCTGSGEADDDDDCRDRGAFAASINPDADELVGDGIDQDCDGSDDCYLDEDLDGIGGSTVITGPDETCDEPGLSDVSGDCLDRGAGAALVYPGADEICNGDDDDCDGLVDDADPDRIGGDTWYADADGDTFGDPAVTAQACEAPTGAVSRAGDCDDDAGAVNPDAVEIPYDGIDQDCVDGDLVDVDGDGVDWPVDCVDGDPAVQPGAVELPDGVDQDCDGIVDEGTVRYDDDGDGVAEDGGDCDDTDPAIAPGAVERGNGLDDDCDGTVDEGTERYDDDGDGFSESDPMPDCHDGDASIYPGAPPRPGSGVDADCSGSIDGSDGDGDGYSVLGGDCDDGDPARRPGAPERANGLDDDCDGVIDEGTVNRDDDGDGASETQGDCDDGDASVGPGAIEDPANYRDDDCDGTVDEGGPHVDDDGDGYTEDAGDCDDADPRVYPYAGELGNGADDDCDGAIDEFVGDADQDGWTAEAGDCDDTTGWANPEQVEVCDGFDNDCNGGVDEGCTGRDEAPEPTPGAEEPAGCACHGGGRRPLSLLALGVLVAVRRRRLPLPSRAG